MTYPKYLVFSAFDESHVFFAERFYPAAKILGIKICVITLNKKLELFIKTKFLIPVIVNTDIPVYANELDSDLVNNSIEVKTARLTFDQARKIYVNTSHSLARSEIHDAIFLIWLPNSVFSIAIANYIDKSQNLKKIYFEFSNFRGRLQADPVGINVSAYSASDECISRFEDFYDENVVETWLKSSFGEKKLGHIKQAAYLNFNKENFSKTIRKFVFQNPLDRRLAKKTYSYIMRNLHHIQYDSDLPDNYIFYPCQLQEDSQLLYYSNLTNESAISEANNIAKSLNCELVVKIHPAEGDYSAIKKILGLKNKLGFSLSNNSSFDLISNSFCVVTINSTVGQEAILLNKDVMVLGNAFYKGFTRKRLLTYLYYCLWDVDFWDTVVITLDQMQILIERCLAPSDITHRIKYFSSQDVTS